MFPIPVHAPQTSIFGSSLIVFICGRLSASGRQVLRCVLCTVLYNFQQQCIAAVEVPPLYFVCFCFAFHCPQSISSRKAYNKKKGGKHSIMLMGGGEDKKKRNMKKRKKQIKPIGGT